MRSTLLLSLVAAAASFSIACAKPAANDQPAPTGSTSAPIGSPEKPHHGKGMMKGPHHGMRGGGPLGMFFREARDLKLSDAQTAKVEELQKGLKDGETPRDEMKTLHEDLVAGIKAGKLDTAKLDADQAALEKAMTARRDKEAEALNALHAALEPQQRKDLVKEIRDKQAKREEKWKDKGDKMKGPGGGEPGKHFGHMTKDLNLDETQQKKVDAIVAKAKDEKATPPDREAMKKRMNDLLTEFEKDTFDAKKTEAFTAKAEGKGFGPMNHKVLAEILPILKPDQREKLADKMSKGPGFKKGPPPGMAPPPAGDTDDDGDDD